jgi:hypothetical protein
MDKMILDSYTFPENPQEIDLVEAKKVVATVTTYEGQAIFQWDETVQDLSVQLRWDNISNTFWDNLRTKYLSTSNVVFNPQNGSTYNVIVEDLIGKYIQYGLEAIPHRKDVELTLNIRSTV